MGKPTAVNIHVPSVPAALRITQTMWEDFLCDPVLATWVIFGVQLDAFQAARLRYYWWIQNVIDSSGVSSGKTIVVWLFVNLRSILLPEQEAAVYYPTFETGKMSFWDYYLKLMRAPIFRAQVGRAAALEPGEEEDGDGTVHGAACYKCFYRNGGKVLMPAPSFVKDAVTQASLRVNTMVIEEWTHIDAMSDGINKQLIDRTTRESYNQNHPIWGNHVLYSAHAQTRMHPSHARYRSHQRKVAGGDPAYANISYSYKDYSSLPKESGKTFRQAHRIDATIQLKKATSGKSEWASQGLGLWGLSGTGWFTEEAIAQCVAQGARRQVTPVLSRRQYEASPIQVQASAS